MTKAEATIEKDLFRFIKASNLAKMVSGEVYRRGLRPEGSDKEDIIVKHLSGTEGQIQQGILIVNIYVPDITLSGDTRKVENTARVEAIEKAAIEFVESCETSEYLYELDQSPRSIEVEGISQHAVTVRIHYQRINC
jgi:hypothetical protein